jgi:protein-tyrosine phosphatase
MTDHDPTTESRRILFVCLGNICRSPLAEGVMRHLAAESGMDGRIQVDSAGTGAWHVGNPPDRRSLSVARKNGVPLEGRARQVEAEDFTHFDLLVAMDRDNLRQLEALRDRAGGGAPVRLLREFDPEANGDLEVPDPYYGGRDGFDRVYEMVHRSCRSLLAALEEDDHLFDSRGSGSEVGPEGPGGPSSP